MLTAGNQALLSSPVGSRFGLSLPPVTPSQLPSIKLSSSPTPPYSQAVAISSLFLRSAPTLKSVPFLVSTPSISIPLVSPSLSMSPVF